ncbi:extracellular solute-binding protein [Streptomyces roseirectus]|uniref:Extracellular solute-binding protein n=1 Tax=Streptomyces roseirectus TaxID=2768066 RepID=A0A7H0ITN6_9ACTN|nr:extracellular solute-binding protein [Streptomyces roseirectus]
MNRRGLLAVLGAGLLGTVTACGDLEDTKARTAAELLAKPAIDTSDGLRVDGELIADQKLYQAARKDTAVLYSGTGQEAEELTVARFEADTGIRVRLTRLPTNKLAERALSEQGAGRLKAGVIRITDPLVAREFAEAGVYVPYRTPFHDRLPRGTALTSDRYWAGYYIVNAMGYNSAVITDDPPTGWQDLTDPRHKGKLGVVAITTGGSVKALARFQIEEFGAGYLRAQARNRARVFDSTSTEVDALARGEIAIASLSFNNAFAAQAAGAPIKLVVPEEGVAGAPTPLGVTEQGLKSPAARVFANWSVSREGQRFAASQGFIAARTDIGRTRAGAYQLPTADSPRAHLLTEDQMERHSKADERVWRKAFDHLG